jgi:subtilisin family serine protease
MPVAAGEQVPAGVSRIEAVTAAGVASTVGLPIGQQVVVGVIDSGVEATHPEITYAGGRSWLNADAAAGSEDAPDTDAYGHGEQLCL